MRKKIMFVIQGEGRGHMTQSLALKSIIEAEGDKVCSVVVGTSGRRKIPEFFRISIGPLTELPSPNFVTDRNNKSVRILPSILFAVKNLPLYLKSLVALHRKVIRTRPDLIINFYEPLLGLYYLLYRPKIPMICIGHQFLLMHSKFRFPEGFAKDKLSLLAFSRLVSARVASRLALSFYPLPDDISRKIHVVPPLLRAEVYEKQPSAEDFLLVYLLNPGYMDDIIRWHSENPEVKLHCFTDKEGMEETMVYDEKLYFHRLNDKKFLDMMASCRGLVTTAGFESVCEAMYFGKPVYMVPVQGHYEQYCNSRDAAYAGAGIFGESFDLSAFMEYLSMERVKHPDFKAWTDLSESLITAEITRVLKIQGHMAPETIDAEAENQHGNN